MKTSIGLLSIVSAISAAAVNWDSAMLVGSLGRDCPFFAPGEEMVFTIRLEGAQGDIPPDTFFIDWERRGDDGIVEKGRAPLSAADSTIVIRTKMDVPGFVCVEANVVTADGKRVPKNHRWEKRVFFMGGAAVEPEKLQPGTEPADYDAFWDRQMARLAAMPVEAELTLAPCADAGVRLYAVRVPCAGPRPVTGWLTMPADASPEKRYPLEVSYRGASHDDQPAPAKGPHDCIRFESNGHGFDLGKGQEYIKEFFAGICKPGYEYGFDPESNGSRETSYWLGMALRAARTLQWAVTLPEWDGKTLNLAAGSQGGWQALMAAANYPRIVRIKSSDTWADNPDWCSRELTRITTSSTWGCDWTGQTEFGRINAGYRPKCWFPDMACFDAIFAAKRIRCPVAITRAGLGDYVCAPSSLAVLYNVLDVPKKIVWRQGWTHGWSPVDMGTWTVDGGFDAVTAPKVGEGGTAAPAPLATQRKRVLTNAISSDEMSRFRMYEQTAEAQFASAAEAESATLSFRELPPDMEMSISARSDDTNWRHLNHASALAAAGAKCTYYICGVSSDYAEKVLRPILALGHSIGSHTRNHPHLSALNANGIFNEILGNRIDIEAATDSCVSSFTLPFCDWGNKANPGTSAAIGEALRRSGILGGGDVLEDPAAAYGLPTNAFVGCLRYSFDDRNPSRDLFVKGVSKAEARIKAKDLPSCGSHVVMGMHSWANDEGMAELTPCFKTRTKNPDAPFAGHIWFCNENEFIAAWMLAHHSRISKVERNGDHVRWKLLRPEPAELGANVPLFAEFSHKPVALTLDGATVPVTESAQTALPNSNAHRVPSLIEHLPADKDDSGDFASPESFIVHSKKFIGVKAALTVDRNSGRGVLYLRNDGVEPLRNLRITLRLPLAFDQTGIPQWSSLPATIDSGDAVDAHFQLERIHDDPWFADGPAMFDAELDFEIGNKAGRLHVSRLAP